MHFGDAHIDAIETLPLTNVPDVVGLNATAEIAHNNQFIYDIWKQLSQCKALFGGLHFIFAFSVFIVFSEFGTSKKINSSFSVRLWIELSYSRFQNLTTSIEKFPILTMFQCNNLI